MGKTQKKLSVEEIDSGIQKLHKNLLEIKIALAQERTKIQKRLNKYNNDIMFHESWLQLNDQPPNSPVLRHIGDLKILIEFLQKDLMDLNIPIESDSNNMSSFVLQPQELTGGRRRVGTKVRRTKVNMKK